MIERCIISKLTQAFLLPDQFLPLLLLTTILGFVAVLLLLLLASPVDGLAANLHAELPPPPSGRGARRGHCSLAVSYFILLIREFSFVVLFSATAFSTRGLDWSYL